MRIAAVVLIAVTGLTGVGCSNVKESADRAKTLNSLKQLGLAYETYQSTNTRPPKSVEELKPLLEGKIPEEFATFTVPWGAGAGAMYKDGPTATTVFAYAPAVKGNVPVLMADYSTKVMTEAEFASAPKVKAK